MVVWHHFVDHGTVMELVHPSEVVDGRELFMPEFVILDPVLHLGPYEVVEVSDKGVVLAEVGEVIEQDVGHSLLLESFVLFG